MTKLEDLKPSATLRGTLPDGLVTVACVQCFGAKTLELTYKNPAGRIANVLLHRHDDPTLALVDHGRPCGFDLAELLERAKEPRSR